MDLPAACTTENFAWHGYFFDAYYFHDEDGTTKTVFRYDVPFSKEIEEIRFAQYGIDSSERRNYYAKLVPCISRQFEIMNLLKEQEIPSILTYHLVHKEKNDETGVSSLYFQTEKVTPIMSKLFRGQINLLTLLDVFIRLSVIIRDISKPPCCVSHRGISMDEVFLTADNKILLGGFFYAAASDNVPELAKPQPYLPEQGRYLPQALLNGEIGSAATDMQTISKILFNLCSGLPWDTEWAGAPNVAPAYIPEELIDVLTFGMNCTDADCNAFRRRLLDCRKALSKTDAAQINIPVRSPLLKEFRYE